MDLNIYAVMAGLIGGSVAAVGFLVAKAKASAAEVEALERQLKEARKPAKSESFADHLHPAFAGLVPVEPSRPAGSIWGFEPSTYWRISKQILEGTTSLGTVAHHTPLDPFPAPKMYHFTWGGANDPVIHCEVEPGKYRPRWVAFNKGRAAQRSEARTASDSH